MIFITGDTHCPSDIAKLKSENFPQESLTKDDYIIIAGDAGFVWHGRDEEDEYWQNWLNDKKFTTLFVDGNHENHEKLDNMPVVMWNGGKVHKLKESVIHLMRGQVYTINGLKIFTMGGAESTDKAHRTEDESWWSREMPSEEEYKEAFINLEKNDWCVDYVITHDASTEIIQDLTIFNTPNKIRNFFLEIDRKLKYKQWFFGHYHDNLRIGDKHTLLYDKTIRINEYRKLEYKEKSEYIRMTEEEYLGSNLPKFLQEDIDRLQEGRRQNEKMRLDLYYNEVQGSINSAYWGGIITEEQANYLRKKLL